MSNVHTTPPSPIGISGARSNASGCRYERPELGRSRAMSDDGLAGLVGVVLVRVGASGS